MRLPLIDARGWVPDEDLPDGFHLTQDGAAKFTRKLHAAVAETSSTRMTSRPSASMARPGLTMTLRALAGETRTSRPSAMPGMKRVLLSQRRTRM